MYDIVYLMKMTDRVTVL